MNKMQIAHEMALELVKIKPSLSAWQIADRCFDYADAMQAEADKRINKERPDVLKEEWQPDWSQAPDNLVQYFAVDENGRGGWFINKPELCSDHWYWSDFEERFNNDCYDHAPSFDYQGNWQDSLRERPNGL